MSSVERELILGGPIDSDLTGLPSGMLAQAGLVVMHHQLLGPAERYTQYDPSQVLDNDAGGIDPDSPDTAEHLVVRAVIAHNVELDKRVDYVAAGMLHPLLDEHETVGKDFYDHMIEIRMLLSSVILIPHRIDREEQGPIIVGEAVVRSQKFVEAHTAVLYEAAEEPDQERAA
jgi:hypothetical protein